MAQGNVLLLGPEATERLKPIIEKTGLDVVRLAGIAMGVMEVFMLPVLEGKELVLVDPTSNSEQVIQMGPVIERARAAQAAAAKKLELVVEVKGPECSQN